MAQDGRTDTQREARSIVFVGVSEISSRRASAVDVKMACLAFLPAALSRQNAAVGKGTR
jgi:hypothetical protein